MAIGRVTEDNELQDRVDDLIRWNPTANPYPLAALVLGRVVRSRLDMALSRCPVTFKVAHYRRGDAEVRRHLERVWARLSARVELVGSLEEAIALQDAIRIVREKEIEAGMDPSNTELPFLPSWDRSLRTQMRVDELVAMPEEEFRRHLLVWADRPITTTFFPPDDGIR